MYANTLYPYNYYQQHNHHPHSSLIGQPIVIDQSANAYTLNVTQAPAVVDGGEYATPKKEQLDEQSLDERNDNGDVNEHMADTAIEDGKIEYQHEDDENSR
jgi:hypothetical protein